jgi:hypothetical protein
MSTTIVDVVGVRTPAMPRGSAVAAALYGRLSGWLRKPSRRLTRAEEAAEVRELAFRVRNTDPGFAADLFAAAARHEALED